MVWDVSVLVLEKIERIERVIPLPVVINHERENTKDTRSKHPQISDGRAPGCHEESFAVPKARGGHQKRENLTK